MKIRRVSANVLVQVLLLILLVGLTQAQGPEPQESETPQALTVGGGAGRLAATATGTLDSPGPPGSTFSYTLVDVYDRLSAGAEGAQSAFAEPASGPTAGTGHTLDEIMAIAPAVDDTHGATQTHVLAGQTAWGLTSGQWGPITGTMPDNGAQTLTPTTISQTIVVGYHDGSGYVAGDADLAVGNIRAGANIFGIAGDSNVVNTSSGDAAAGEILLDKRAWVDGIEIVGSGVITPGAPGEPAPVPKTGQTDCHKSATPWEACTCGTADCPSGQDGDLEKGVAWPNPRFITGVTGIVTDTLTGLIWLENANCFGQRGWATALSDANTLNSAECGLTDGSVQGDWRLPNVRELQSLIDYGEYIPALPDGHPFTGVQSDNYWSSTVHAVNTSYSWRVNLYRGSVYYNDLTSPFYVWPVRGGQ